RMREREAQEKARHLHDGDQRDQADRNREGRIRRREEAAHQAPGFIALTAARRSRMRLSRAIFSSSASLLAVRLCALTVPATPVALPSTRLNAPSALSARRIAPGPAEPAAAAPPASAVSAGREAR